MFSFLDLSFDQRLMLALFVLLPCVAFPLVGSIAGRARRPWAFVACLVMFTMLICYLQALPGPLYDHPVDELCRVSRTWSPVLSLLFFVRARAARRRERVVKGFDVIVGDRT